jgi:hypothetical protein
LPTRRSQSSVTMNRSKANLFLSFTKSFRIVAMQRRLRGKRRRLRGTGKRLAGVETRRAGAEHPGVAA